LPNELKNGSGSSREAKKLEEPEPKPLGAYPKGVLLSTTMVVRDRALPIGIAELE
jgi:hypothetical protein